jgi:hypothetical protein
MVSLSWAARATNQNRPARAPRRPLAQRAPLFVLRAGLAAGLVAASSAVAPSTAMAGRLPIGQLAHGGPPPGARTQHNGHQLTLTGTVASVGARSFVLATAQGMTWTIDVSSSTTYAERGSSSPSLANVGGGDGAMVSGTQVTTSTVDATSVVISPPAATSGSGKGGSGNPVGRSRPGH